MLGSQVLLATSPGSGSMSYYGDKIINFLRFSFLISKMKVLN